MSGVGDAIHHFPSEVRVIVPDPLYHYDLVAKFEILDSVGYRFSCLVLPPTISVRFGMLRKFGADNVRV